MPDKRGGERDGPAQATADDGTQWVTLGQISGLYGVRGWLKVFSHTSPRDNILSYPVWTLVQNGKQTTHKLSSGKVHGKGIIAQLEGIDDRDAAVLLLQSEIKVPRTQLPETGSDEFYWTDLEGLKVTTLEGVDLGKVDHLFETGANDVIVVKGDKQRLIPFIQDVVVNIDLENAVLTVDWDPDF
ncbi:MAG: ribosome maturation factor RimM [Sedimenticola sp.]|jgi:16S rRNA processing protein RimM|nr:MAG: ribosome maturation factor RimM [Sedimenticola sp.]